MSELQAPPAPPAADAKPEASTLPSPADRPESEVVIYDGHCNFCRAQVERLQWWDCQDKLSYISLHDPEVARRWPDLPKERLLEEMCLIDRRGRRHWGPEAFRYLTYRLRRLWWLMPVMYLPGMMLIARPVYRWISRHRYLIAGKTECDSGSCSLHR